MNIFDWTPELEYIVGLMVTDGNLSKDKRHMSMRSSDLDLLNTFKICLNLKNKISQTKNDGYAKRPCYRIQFGNVQLYQWFEQIGIFPNKTYTIGEIKIPDKYFRDFFKRAFRWRWYYINLSR
ncbi:MAG: LAGLIDADG family homing endonuclease [Patescibacteria group bacterium]